MNKNKKIMITILVIILILILGVIIYNVSKNNTKDQEDISESQEQDDEEIGLTGLIDNEEYYYEKQKEYYAVSDEYDKLVKEFANERFTDEQKSVIADYHSRLAELSKSSNKQEKIDLGYEYAKVYQEYMNQSFTSEQLEIVNSKKEIIDKLQPIVDEYQEKIAEAEEKKSKEGLETLADGRIKNTRQGIISEKTYDGLKFSDIELIYDPTTDETTIKMTITNETNETKKEKYATLHFTGNTECKYLIKLEEISAGEYIQIEFPMKTDLKDTDTFEIIDYNEDDYKKV